MGLAVEAAFIALICVDTGTVITKVRWVTPSTVIKVLLMYEKYPIRLQIEYEYNDEVL
jgi:hypothetical protein